MNQKTTERLWHGTSDCPPIEIYKEKGTGFNINFANIRGSQGKGLYFAKNAEYSCSGY